MGYFLTQPGGLGIRMVSPQLSRLDHLYSNLAVQGAGSTGACKESPWKVGKREVVT